jgi:hypothetical protein
MLVLTITLMSLAADIKDFHVKIQLIVSSQVQ